MKKGYNYALSKLCFFNGSGNFKKLAYTVTKGKGSLLDCERCHFRERCIKKQNVFKLKEKENE